MGALLALCPNCVLGLATALLPALLYHLLPEERLDEPKWPLSWLGVPAGQTVAVPASVRLTPLPAQAHR